MPYSLQLENITDETEFKDLINSDEYDFRFTCGVTQASHHLSLSEKAKLISAFCLHYSILVSLAELEQLRHGLAILGFDSLMAAYQLREAFEPKQKITSDYMQN